MQGLRDHFRSVDGRDRSEWERLQRQFLRNRTEQDRRAKQEDRLDDQMMALAAEVVMATDRQIREFETKLRTYEEATVVALMENQEQLDLVRARLDAMLAQAYVLEDGRRAFRTEDGTQVFDEFGQEVGADEIDPVQIDPSLPTWEAFSADLELEQALQNEREAIIEYQDRLDDAREQIADGEISEAELEELDAELADFMPPSVRQNVPGMEIAEPVPELSASFARSVTTPQMQSAGANTPAPTPMQ